ncbi:hypothetical protein BDZ89DRAFT_455667 [Hymenopellis radicata]|nr:hypothetical protein BDZ89DRAFT_455667 [Hymenopellis radicata]
MGSILIAISLLPQPGRSFIVLTPDLSHDTHFDPMRILLGINVVHHLSRCHARSHVSLRPAIWTLPRAAHDPIVVDSGQLARFCNRVYSEFQASTRAFVAFLSILRTRLRIDWPGFMRQLLKLVDVPGEGMYFQSLCSQLHMQNVYTVDAFTPDILIPMSPFRARRAFTYFDCFTAIVCLVISCPPSSTVSTLRTTSGLCCEIVHAERKARHRFLPFNATYGHVQYKRYIPAIMEDDNIDSNLVVTFWVPFWLLDVFPASTSIKLICDSEEIFSTHPLDTQHCFISSGWPVFSHSAQQLRALRCLRHRTWLNQTHRT